ncbi:DUF1054 domain-containing protein [Halalkalibacter urbisdiaboli]|uniref:DUF1054 domain-containing protein n=1 Tax=Halalkalibacter urbisdiaboli TaxID=1960589 RepID=UPI000B44F246|nr:DUF1054 domain-containing protein [Halalkalibacter urbisdiaboli]
MTFEGFTQQDFDVFAIEGLEPRMKAIQERIQPKFEAISKHIVPSLAVLTGDEIFPHIAKHARRKVNPPNDTWVAFANNKRGYKMLPHFQVGLFGSHLFIWFAVIYEAQAKGVFGERLLSDVEKWSKLIPSEFVWSIDHMKPDALKHDELTVQQLASMFERLRDVKKAELLCGIHLDRHDPLLSNGDKLLAKIEEVYETVLPLYQEAQQSAVPSTQNF